MEKCDVIVVVGRIS